MSITVENKVNAEKVLFKDLKICDGFLLDTCVYIKVDMDSNVSNGINLTKGNMYLIQPTTEVVEIDLRIMALRKVKD